MGKKSFVMYMSWMPMMKALPDSALAELMRAIAAYQMGEEYEISDPVVSGIFQMVKATFDEDTEKYEEKCRVRAEAGSAGGKQKVANASKSKQTVANASKSKQNLPDTEVESDSDNDSDKDLLKDFCTVPSPEGPAPADVEAIPLNDGSEWTPTEQELAEYERLYPAVDVKQEFRNMRGWSNGNPTKKKTRSGVRRFVTNWLAKEQNKGHPQERAAPAKKNTFSMSENHIDVDNLEKILLRRGS